MCQLFTNLEIEKLYKKGMPKKVCLKLLEKLTKEKENNMNENIATSEMMAENDNVDSAESFEKLNCLCNNNEKNILSDKNFNANNLKIENQSKNNYNDILQISTQWTRIFFTKINKFSHKAQNSFYYKTITSTTQPAHVIAAGITLLVLFTIQPNVVENESLESQSYNNNQNSIASLIYLAAFAIHFGAQVWMTFVSGLSLYFSLPRHTFGLCQQILFPKYFALNAMLSICTLIMYTRVINGHWEFSSGTQAVLLTLCAAIEVTIRLYLAPPLLRLMKQKHEFEKNSDSGHEIGYLDAKDLMKCPVYRNIHKSFRQFHMVIAIGNITVLIFTIIHLYYLASKIVVI